MRGVGTLRALPHSIPVAACCVLAASRISWLLPGLTSAFAGATGVHRVRRALASHHFAGVHRSYELRCLRSLRLADGKTPAGYGKVGVYFVHRGHSLSVAQNVCRQCITTALSPFALPSSLCRLSPIRGAATDTHNCTYCVPIASTASLRFSCPGPPPCALLQR